MAKLYNLARMTTATTGTGTITLGVAAAGYLTFALAGVVDGDVVAYGIKDGNNSEVGTGTYTASGTTLTRSVTKSTNSNSPINLSGTAEVFIIARAEDILNAASNLADVASPSTALTNLGGQAALGFVPLNKASNLSDVATPATALSNIGGQPALGFTPVQQGTGTGQGSNAVKLGWSGTALKATVDTTDLGDIVTTAAGHTREMVLLNTLTASSSVNLSDTTSFTATYSHYMLVFENLIPATTNTQLQLQVNSGGVQATSYVDNGLVWSSGGPSGIAQSTTAMVLTDATCANSAPGVSGELRVTQPSQAASPKQWWGRFSYKATSAQVSQGSMSNGYWNGGNGAITGFQVQFSSGNISTGVIRIYGLK